MFSQTGLCRWWTACRFYSLRRFKPDPALIAQHASEDGKEPHLLHVVWRIRSTIGRPHWEKKMVTKLGLEKRFQPVIHKNTPELNKDLTTVRHLIRVKPLTLNQGLPNGDYEETLVTWSGELIRKPKLESTRTAQTDVSDSCDSSVKE